MNQSALTAYQSNQAIGVSPVMTVAYLYDKIIESLHQAAKCCENGDISGRWSHNKKAADILAQLATALDLVNGGEIAGNLERLYKYMLLRLMDVDMKNDPAAAREVIELCEPLRKSWHTLARQMDQQAEQQQAGTDTAEGAAPSTEGGVDITDTGAPSPMAQQAGYGASGQSAGVRTSSAEIVA